MNRFHLPNAVVEQMGWVLVHSVWEMALIALVALALTWAMRRRSAKARYGLLVVALAAMTAAPVATLLVLPRSQPIPLTAAETALAPIELPAVDWQPGAAQSAEPTFSVTRAPGDVAGVADARNRPPETGGSDTWMAIRAPWSSVGLAVQAWLPQIVELWCLGMFLFAWRPVLSLRELGRLRHQGVLPPGERITVALAELARRMRLARRVTVLQSTRVRVPVVVGYLRPVILLPVSFVSQLPLAQLDAILAHELAHIRRHDYLVNLWQVLVETIFFYHPAVWWLSRRIRAERENCCDDVAVTVVENRVEYGRALLALEELRGGATALALGARGGSLLARIGRLFPGERGHRTLDSSNLAALGLLACAIVAVTIWATAVAKERAEAAPTAETADAAEEPIDPDASYIDAVSDRFAAALKKQDLPYVTPEIRDALRTELHDYLAARVTKPLEGPNRREVLKAIDSFVARNLPGPGSYLSFRNKFNILGWQLWTATERAELTPDEAEERTRQREWMRSYVRSLPMTPIAQNVPQWQHEARIAAVENEVFANPLSPFFHDPMPAEEFAAFTKRVETSRDVVSAPANIFASAVIARQDSLLRRWPPGFAVNGNHISNTQDFDFNGSQNEGFLWGSSPLRTGKRTYFDVAQGVGVEQPPPLDEKSTERWLTQTGQGDIRFNGATRRLVAVRGAKLATLDETDWHALDRIPLAELRKRLADAPLDSYSLMKLPEMNGPGGPSAVDKAVEGLPTLVLETAEGKVILLRIAHSFGDYVYLRGRPRPLPPYLPFAPGDAEYPELAEARSKEQAAAAASKAAIKRLQQLGIWVAVFSAPQELHGTHQELTFNQEWKGNDEDWKLLEAIEHPENLMLVLNTDRLAGLARIHLAQPLAKITFRLRSDEPLAGVDRLPACRWAVVDNETLTPDGYRKLFSLIPDVEKLEFAGMSRDADRYSPDNDLVAALAGGLEHLTALRLQRPIGVDGLQAVGRLANLKELAISTDGAAPKDVEPLSSLIRLERLRIKTSRQESGAPDRRGEMATGDAIARIAGGMPTLRVLDVGLRMSQQGLGAIAGIEKLQSLHVALQQVDDASVAAAARLSRLRVLRMEGEGALSDPGLAPLAKLALLTHLELPGTALTDAALSHLAPLTALKSLTVEGGQFTGAGLAGLKGLTHLRSLDLAGSQFNDDGCRLLPNVLPKLALLDLGQTRITDAGAAEIAKLSQLRGLELNGTGVGDDGAAELAKLPYLRVLDLTGSKVTDDGLDEFSGVKELVWLNVAETGVTTQGVARLQAALPKGSSVRDVAPRGGPARRRLEPVYEPVEEEAEGVPAADHKQSTGPTTAKAAGAAADSADAASEKRKAALEERPALGSTTAAKQEVGEARRLLDRMEEGNPGKKNL